MIEAGLAVLAFVLALVVGFYAAVLGAGWKTYRHVHEVLYWDQLVIRQDARQLLDRCSRMLGQLEDLRKVAEGRPSWRVRS